MSVVITAHPEPLLTPPPLVAGTNLVRYVAAGVPAQFAMVDIASAESPSVADTLVGLQRTLSERARSGRYDVLDVSAQAAPVFRTDGREAEVTFVNCFEVEPGREDEAFGVWQEFNAYFVQQPGYRAHTLHRRAAEDAAFGLVNVVRWESPEAWAAAHDDRFRAMVARPLPFISLPTLTRPVLTGAEVAS